MAEEALVKMQGRYQQMQQMLSQAWLDVAVAVARMCTSLGKQGWTMLLHMSVVVA